VTPGSAVTNGGAIRSAVHVSLQIRVPMLARSVDEPHRASSQLELLFDLTFVIAVAALAHHFAVAIGGGQTWALHAPITPQPLLRPRSVLSACLLILLLPAFAEHIGVVMVLAALATVSAAVVADVVARQRKEHR
jgi:hypothetical protein